MEHKLIYNFKPILKMKLKNIKILNLINLSQHKLYNVMFLKPFNSLLCINLKLNLLSKFLNNNKLIIQNLFL